MDCVCVCDMDCTRLTWINSDQLGFNSIDYLHFSFVRWRPVRGSRDPRSESKRSVIGPAIWRGKCHKESLKVSKRYHRYQRGFPLDPFQNSDSDRQGEQNHPIQTGRRLGRISELGEESVLFQDARFKAEVTRSWVVESGQVEESEGVVHVGFLSLTEVVQWQHRAAVRYRLHVVLIHVVGFE